MAKKMSLKTEFPFFLMFVYPGMTISTMFVIKSVRVLIL